MEQSKGVECGRRKVSADVVKPHYIYIYNSVGNKAKTNLSKIQHERINTISLPASVANGMNPKCNCWFAGRTCTTFNVGYNNITTGH